MIGTKKDMLAFAHKNPRAYISGWEIFGLFIWSAKYPKAPVLPCERTTVGNSGLIKCSGGIDMPRG
jgi:hypothetical protein